MYFGQFIGFIFAFLILSLIISIVLLICWVLLWIAEYFNFSIWLSDRAKSNIIKDLKSLSWKRWIVTVVVSRINFLPLYLIGKRRLRSKLNTLIIKSLKKAKFKINKKTQFKDIITSEMLSSLEDCPDLKFFCNQQFRRSVKEFNSSVYSREEDFAFVMGDSFVAIFNDKEIPNLQFNSGEYIRELSSGPASEQFEIGENYKYVVEVMSENDWLFRSISNSIYVLKMEQKLLICIDIFGVDSPLSVTQEVIKAFKSNNLKIEKRNQ